MTPFTRTALAVLTAATVSSAALMPAHAQAGPQEAPRAAHHGVQQFGPGGFGSHGRPGPGAHFGHQTGLIQMLVSARGAEAIDVAAVRLAHRLDLTEAQQDLLENLRAAALDAQESLGDARAAMAPDSEADVGNPDLVARYAGIVAMTTARAEALEAMQPAFEAFVASLDEDQLEALYPQRPGGSAPERRGPPPSQPAAPRD